MAAPPSPKLLPDSGLDVIGHRKPEVPGRNKSFDEGKTSAQKLPGQRTKPKGYTGASNARWKAKTIGASTNPNPKPASQKTQPGQRPPKVGP
jgi:hypothetical protein